MRNKMSFQIISSDTSTYLNNAIVSKLKDLELQVAKIKEQITHDEFINNIKHKTNKIGDQTLLKIDNFASEVLRNITKSINSSPIVMSMKEDIKNLMNHHPTHVDNVNNNDVETFDLLLAEDTTTKIDNIVTMALMSLKTSVNLLSSQITDIKLQLPAIIDSELIHELTRLIKLVEITNLNVEHHLENVNETFQTIITEILSQEPHAKLQLPYKN
ncbi:hypothetical protein LCDV1gp010 [Lymphocystis disease virus 1]|uniref:hypothetical protein n=1 Tax=Fish lymphocystis disease virus TaxID=36363 RepID=UPI0000161ED1|nr:hypothetical protein LCDV1gp010 [Lymphocystis disease virus 1]